MKTIWYIHGANSTALVFNRIKEKLPTHTAVDIGYDSNLPLRATIAELKKQALQVVEPFSIISHSLGGIIATYLAAAPIPIDRIVTLSTPFGGSKEADLLKWMFPNQVFRDISTASPIITGIPKVKVPMLSFVTSAMPNPLISEPNDGVVTVSTQRALSGPTYINIKLNHIEVLLSDEPIKLIIEFLFNSGRPHPTPREAPSN